MRALLLVFLVSPLACVGDSGSPDSGTDAAADSGSDSPADVTTEASADSVDGVVIDTFFAPRQGAKVSIGGVIATTDAQGKFSIKPVPTTPYDVWVADVDATVQHEIIGFIGLTTRTPTLQSTWAGTFRQSGAVTGQLTGATFPGVSSQGVAVWWDSPRSYHYATGSVGADKIPAGGAWDAANVTGTWFGDTNEAGNVYALVYSVSNGITGFSGVGNVTAALTAGQAKSGLSLALTNPSSKHDTGNLNLSGLTATSNAVYIHADTSRSALFLETIPANNGAIDILVPDAPNVTATLSATAHDSQNDTSTVWKARMAPGALFGTIVMPTPIAASSPADNASNVDATTSYTWSKAAGTVVYHLGVICGTNPAPFALDVITTSTSAQLPVAKTLSDLGVVFPTGTQCLWTASSIAPANTIDDFATAAGWSDKVTDYTASADGSRTTTAQRKFTTP